MCLHIELLYQSEAKTCNQMTTLLPKKQPKTLHLITSQWTYRLVNGERAPQGHQGFVAIGADESLLIEDAITLVRLQHPGSTKKRVLLFCSGC